MLAVASEGKADVVLLLFGLAGAVFVFRAAGTPPCAGTRGDSVGIRCWDQVAVCLSTLAALISNPRRRKQIDAPLRSFYDDFRVERMTLHLLCSSTGTNQCSPGPVACRFSPS